MSIHSAIASLRKRAKLSQQQLADAVNALLPPDQQLTRQAVQHWEKEGGTAPKRARLHAAAKVLGTSVERLVAGNIEPLPGAGLSQEDQQLLQQLESELTRHELPSEVRSVILQLVSTSPPKKGTAGSE